VLNESSATLIVSSTQFLFLHVSLPKSWVMASSVTDGGQGANAPSGISDVGPFLELGLLNSASFAFKTSFKNLKLLVYAINLFLLLLQCLAKLCARAFLNGNCIVTIISLV